MKKPLPAQLNQPLSKLRSRCVALACVRGLGIGALIFFSGALLIGWADLIVATPPALRLTALAALLLSIVVALLWAMTSARRRASTAALASALDRAGATGGQIRAGAE